MHRGTSSTSSTRSANVTCSVRVTPQQLTLMSTLRTPSRLIVTCLMLVGLVACTPAQGALRDSVVTRAPSAIANPPAASYGLKLLPGSGFTLGIPIDAIVDRRVDSLGNPHWSVHAPTQLITAALGTADTTRFTDDRPLYVLQISLGRKAAGRSLKAWGDSLVAAHEAVADELDKGESGRLVTVAGTEAYLREPSCGDCGDYIFTFANADRLVEVEYTVDTAEPLAMRKHGIYALILSTFRWSASGAP
jgi:hypothetical protein